jgi:hypothetical protein
MQEYDQIDFWLHEQATSEGMPEPRDTRELPARILTYEQSETIRD